MRYEIWDWRFGIRDLGFGIRLEDMIPIENPPSQAVADQCDILDF